MACFLSPGLKYVQTWSVQARRRALGKGGEDTGEGGGGDAEDLVGPAIVEVERARSLGTPRVGTHYLPTREDDVWHLALALVGLNRLEDGVGHARCHLDARSVEERSAEPVGRVE